MEPADRDAVVREFREGVTKVLIATDVLARGFDVSQVGGGGEGEGGGRGATYGAVRPNRDGKQGWGLSAEGGRTPVMFMDRGRAQGSSAAGNRRTLGRWRGAASGRVEGRRPRGCFACNAATDTANNHSLSPPTKLPDRVPSRRQSPAPPPIVTR
jgi:hypothetical protein